MTRTPPANVRRLLRKEVGFGCPVPDCANPYLEYHHFDPPWSEREHHDPEGMIALCTMHHKQADVGTFTNDQLRHMKETIAPDGVVRGRFNWMRNDILPVVGSNLWPGTTKILRYNGFPIIWFRKDEAGFQRLNLRMLSTSGEPRLLLDDNDWILKGCPTEFSSPPSGRLISARYANGDYLKVEFFELSSSDTAALRYPQVPPEYIADLRFPQTAVEVSATVAGAPISFTPQGLQIKSPRHNVHIADSVITCTDFALDL